MASFLLNLIYVVIQIVMATFAHSTSLLADAGHNLGDVAAIGFSGIANRLIRSHARGQFTYGFKKLSLFSTLTSACIMMGTCTWIVIESIEHFLHPAPVNEWIVICIALIGVLMNGGSALLFWGRHKEDMNVRSTLIHLAGDAAVSFGVAITGVIIGLTHFYWLDPIIGIMIALLIIVSTLKIFKASFALLLDAAPKNLNPDEIRGLIEKTKGVSAIHDLHIWAMSTQHNALTAHLSVHIPLEQRDLLIKSISETLKTQYSLHHITLQIEGEDHNCGQQC